MAISTSRSKNVSGRSQKPGSYGKRIIKTFIRDGREWQFHATKGWRSYRVVK